MSAAKSDSTFPPPPPFYHLYTDESKEEKSWIWSPPAPLNQTYSTLEITRKNGLIERELKDYRGNDVPKLYDDTNGQIAYSIELRKLNKCVLKTYLDILDAIIHDHSKLDKLVTHFDHLLMNSSHLLNLLRPHQARQTLIAIMQRQINERNAKAQELESLVEDAKTFLDKQGISFDGERVVLKPRTKEMEVEVAAELDCFSALKTQLDSVDPFI